MERPSGGWMLIVAGVVLCAAALGCVAGAAIVALAVRRAPPTASVARATGAAPTVAVTEPRTFADPVAGVEWTVDASPSPLSWTEAQAWCAHLPTTGRAWRLPTQRELASVADPASPELARQPFRSLPPFTGYLFSGELVAGQPGQPWVMNLRNAHVFNGSGYSAYTRCVR